MKNGFSLYIIDDEESLARGLAFELRKDYQVEIFFKAETAFAAFEEKEPDLVLLDVGLPGMSGIEALGKIRGRFPYVLVIMITAYEDIDTVIAAMRIGAYDYIVKPIDIESLESIVRKALESIRLRKEVRRLQAEFIKEKFPIIISNSKVINDVLKLVECIAKSPDTPVLITGESGTGKELIAGAIHSRSPRFREPMVTVNCAAIPADLVESELFGHEPGAFTGASQAGRKGFVEQAAGGTLFLDEIGDLSLEAQAKILRFLENGSFYKVGGSGERKVTTRVIAATNKNLEELIRDGRFREDLFYRINVVTIEMPSLDERPEDIIAMARHFIGEFGERLGRNFTGLHHSAKEALRRHRWRGNVRELRNMIERACILAEGPVIQLADLRLPKEYPEPAEKRRVGLAHSDGIPAAGLDLAALLQGMEKQYIGEALNLAHGNETRAADFLKMKYTTFRYRRRIHGL